METSERARLVLVRMSGETAPPLRSGGEKHIKRKQLLS
jgi:hypothetical protein